MTKFFYFILFCAITASLLCSCNLEEIPDNSIPGGTGNAGKFETTVGGNSNDFPNDAIAASDGGFVIAGYSQSFTAINDNQAYLVKLDAKGKQLWESNFGGTADDYAEAVIQTPDGGYVLCGRTRSFSTSQDLYLVKVSASGSKVWEKSYGAVDSTEAAFGIVPVGTGDFLVGYLSDKGTGTSQLKFLRVNSNGTKISNKLALSGKFGMEGMIKTSDGKIVVVGSEFATNGTITYVLKYNEDGSFVWENRYPAQATNYTPSFDLVELSDKSIVIAGSDLGSNDHDFNLVAYNQIGGKIWNKTWGGANADELFDVVVSKDNQLVVMGYTASFSGKSQFYISKRKASDGNMIWERNFIDIANLWGSLAASSDGGFLVVAGQNAANADILIVKTNENGEYK